MALALCILNVFCVVMLISIMLTIPLGPVLTVAYIVVIATNTFWAVRCGSDIGRW